MYLHLEYATPSQPIFALTPICRVLSGKARDANLSSLF